MSNDSNAKQAVGVAAAQMVQDGMVLGLGTGSTARCAIEAIGERRRMEGLQVNGIPTSYQAERLAREQGIPLTTFDEVDRLDLAFDGADEVDPDLDLIKGRGGAHAREKVVASQADRFIVLIDTTKLTDTLGTKAPVPVEVLPMAATPVGRALRELGAEATLRTAERKDGPVVTDQGLWIIDARFDGISDPAWLNDRLNALPGVLDHGIFVGLTREVLIGNENGTVERREKQKVRSSSAG